MDHSFSRQTQTAFSIGMFIQIIRTSIFQNNVSVMQSSQDPQQL